MADAVDMKEDGEVRFQSIKAWNLRINSIFTFFSPQIESDEGELYTKLERPHQEIKVNSVNQESYNSESSANDSDGETPNKIFKRLEK